MQRAAQYRFPSHYPEGCPPQPHDEKCGIYYRLVRNNNILDPQHFRSYYETKERLNLEDSDPCNRRAVSIFREREDALSLMKNFPKKGKFIAKLDLCGNHGIVKHDYETKWSHHNWWIPLGIRPNSYCVGIEGPFL